MTQRSALSPQLLNLIRFTEESLDTEIVLHRQPDCPPCGILVDTYTYETEKNVIVYPAAFLGLLKDFVIALNVTRLLIRGTAYQTGHYEVLSYEPEGVALGMGQIYLDLLKDEHTRLLSLFQKKKIPFYLYKLFHDTLSEIPWGILSHTFLAVHFPVMRSAQLYFLIKESLRDMHELVEVKNYIPRRYFVLHNGMFYARDMLLASILSEYKLNPLINIPELQRFRNLDIKEMMTYRWSRSHWYQTKMVGDTMYTMLRQELPSPRGDQWNPSDMVQGYHHGRAITSNFITLMQMSGWYIWDTPAHLLSAEHHQAEIERMAFIRIFGE
jgi:hypothetical protein